MTEKLEEMGGPQTESRDSAAQYLNTEAGERKQPTRGEPGTDMDIKGSGAGLGSGTR